MARFSISNNKVARRIFLSFLLAAMIPTGLFGVLSYFHVNDQLREQTQQSLRKEVKDYAMGLVDRLVFDQNALRMIAAGFGSAEDSGKAKEPNEHFKELKQFKSLHVIDPSGHSQVLMGLETEMPAVEVLQAQALADDKTIVMTQRADTGGNLRIWMATAVGHSQVDKGVLLAELQPDILWDTDNFPSGFLWIFKEDGNPVFITEHAPLLSNDVKRSLLRSVSGLLAWENSEDSYQGAFWKLPIKTILSAPEFVIVLAKPHALAFRYMERFRDIYPPVISLAVLMVALFSAFLIKKYLTPLGRLQMATQKISEGDFTYRVEIDSQDEFEDLAHSFNDMTQRLRGQFDILATMSEIDRQILSSLNADRIIETALDRLPKLFSCDLIAVAAINPETGIINDIRVKISDHAADLLPGEVKLEPDGVRMLSDATASVVETGADGDFSSLFATFGKVTGWRYLLAPVEINGVLSSLLCLGYKFDNPMPSNAPVAVRNFADRLAVALSNAAWEEKLYLQAHFDSLTGLPNRLVLNDHIAQELARAKRNNTQFAVIFVDLDRFKNVNDALGHPAGDSLLLEVAQLISGCVRDTDLVARLGGDEFVIVVGEIHRSYNPISFYSATAERVMDSLNKTFVVCGHELTVTASQGIAVYPSDGETIEDLLKNADAAMYYAKNQGRANFRFYSSELNVSVLENIKLEHHLRNSIVNSELRVYYQPKYDVSGQIVGAEALIRWLHPEMGMVSPAKFIPLAEQSGFILQIGEWVLEQVCLLVKYCLESAIEPVRISVNLSVIEFKRVELVQNIANILSRTGVDPKYIEFELTESVAIDEAEACKSRMNELKRLGLKLSMDDFGTGFSSLSYLKDLPLDVLKIDQTFMRHVDSDTNSQAIVKAILALAKGLGMESVAEGIETPSQLEFMKDNDCNTYQGYLFSKPIPEQDFIQLLQKIAG